MVINILATVLVATFVFNWIDDFKNMENKWLLFGICILGALSFCYILYAIWR